MAPGALSREAALPAAALASPRQTTRAATEATRYSAGSINGARTMTLCPVALSVGCKKCPIYTVCPAKGIIGDASKTSDPPAEKPMAKPHRKN